MRQRVPCCRWKIRAKQKPGPTAFLLVEPGFLSGAREGIRTPNLLIRSQMLYPLSYARI